MRAFKTRILQPQVRSDMTHTYNNVKIWDMQKDDDYASLSDLVLRNQFEC